ncbi:hypothetical protein DYY67_0590 [Candidatus Nitrosotalea sp. TS]|nr:hypothetical protein [Candidatus Nitrosotalea sp. TS]
MGFHSINGISCRSREDPDRPGITAIVIDDDVLTRSPFFVNF